MVSKILRHMLAPLVGLCAMPVIWASPAEATFVSCTPGKERGTFPLYVSGTTFSVECVSGLLSTSTDVAGKATNFGNNGVQSNLIWRGNVSVSAHAYAFGYRIGQNGPQQISGCVADDITADGAWRTKTCAEPVVYVDLVVNGD